MITPVRTRPQNWVFLGDSLTEGVGSSRVSYVSELARLLREPESQKPRTERRAIHEFRLRQVDPETFNRFLRVNTAGIWNREADAPGGALWLWNLASEGTTIANDLEWLPLIENLQPERVFVFRGGLESIVRPAALGGQWPWWVPHSWRGYASMDPRCYFSTTWWRRAKQVAIDTLKQKVRLNLLRRQPGVTLLDERTLLSHYRALLVALRELESLVLVLSLVPPDGERFPGSVGTFTRMNQQLHELTATEGVDFFDWAPQFTTRHEQEQLFYRDGFHPNQVGARVLASTLHERLFSLGAQCIWNSASR